MTDVQVVDTSAIVRREVDRESTERALAVMDPSILDTIFASREPSAIVERIANVSTVLMDAVHQRDLARRYGDSQNEFLHIEAWEFLSSMLGMTVVGVDSRPLADGSGWEATAELRHVASGRVMGRRDGMCQRSEPSMRRKSGVAPDNTIRQMAQIRAARSAARSVLGFVPKIGGFEISDPDAPVTYPQLGMLHQLERELGWSHEEGHARAGVESYKDLTRDRATAVIDEWTVERDKTSGVDPPLPDDAAAPDAHGEADGAAEPVEEPGSEADLDGAASSADSGSSAPSESEALLDQALSLYPSEAALVSAAHKLNVRVTKIGDIGPSLARRLIKDRS